jgi:hypothetical protein
LNAQRVSLVFLFRRALGVQADIPKEKKGVAMAIPDQESMATGRHPPSRDSVCDWRMALSPLLLYLPAKSLPRRSAAGARVSMTARLPVPANYPLLHHQKKPSGLVS